MTNPADAAFAVDAGADAIGINLFPGSKRFVELDGVRDWVREIPAVRVAVVVNPGESLLAAIAAAGCFDAIQFHGDETPDFCARSPLPWLRAIRVAGPEAIAAAVAFDTRMLLLDAASASGYGGTGEAIDRVLAAQFVSGHPDHCVVLAGGLTPATVGGAVRAVRPCAVDVASGVEMDGDPRRKDPEKIRAFISAARSA